MPLTEQNKAEFTIFREFPTASSCGVVHIAQQTTASLLGLYDADTPRFDVGSGSDFAMAELK